MRLYIRFILLALLGLAVVEGVGFGQRLYYQKCLFTLKRRTKELYRECEEGMRFINKNKNSLNTKNDDLFSKAKIIREATISGVIKFTTEKQAAAADKKNSEEILQCLNSSKKYYIERLEFTGPKLEDDYRTMLKFASDDMDALYKSIAEIKSGVKKKYTDAEQDLNRCKGIKCLMETSERLNREYTTLKVKVQKTSKGAEPILKNFFYKSANLYQPYVNIVTSLQTDAEAAMNKCLNGKFNKKLK